MAHSVSQGKHASAATDRELRMIEVKEEINVLSAELGQEPRYDVSGDEERQRSLATAEPASPATAQVTGES